MSWQIVLDDGSKHDVDVRIRYEPGGKNEIQSGVLIGDLDVLVLAANDLSVFLERSSGERAPINVTQEDREFLFYPRR
ncbi:hypothetical protein [Agrobacterium pusense]|uniref:hypothetical protein n=1 Tax=Agrobacterium pusense TaxID=648995 RepID=UPI0005142BCC|nr:hypothetical protein [Agrobacterium pusense]ANV22833.1 hypothetical protein BA939_02015 [Rhizobium sp. S41]KGE84756.1 hypothetical protein LW14_02095 [Rhizobium sp. H41]QWW75099.1 hypothetical protein KP800_06435 [Agrobacterium pusense]